MLPSCYYQFHIYIYYLLKIWKLVSRKLSHSPSSNLKSWGGGNQDYKSFFFWGGVIFILTGIFYKQKDDGVIPYPPYPIFYFKLILVLELFKD